VLAAVQLIAEIYRLQQRKRHFIQLCGTDKSVGEKKECDIIFPFFFKWKALGNLAIATGKKKRKACIRVCDYLRVILPDESELRDLVIGPECEVFHDANLLD
jgi:hypothetical protein